MKVELKSIKVRAWASDESTCFRAVLWIDGRKAAHVGNDGHGGPTHFDFFDEAQFPAFRDWVNAQPPLQTEFGPLPMNGELFVDELLQNHLEALERARIERKAKRESSR